MRILRFKCIIIKIIFFVMGAGIGGNYVFGEGMEARFKNEKKLVYNISFNGIPSGYIEWMYLGRQELEGVAVEAITANSDTKILKLLNLTSKERVFLDFETHLPLKVERDIVFFGRKEIISETYFQEQGFVKIGKSNSKNDESVLYQDKPIHNILELLYFFPQDVKLKAGEWMIFNLPTQKVKIKMVRERILKVNGKKVDTYFMVGKGAKRFNLWLDKKDKMPLRLEFITLVGKIIISRKGEQNDPS